MRVTKGKDQHSIFYFTGGHIRHIINILHKPYTRVTKPLALRKPGIKRFLSILTTLGSRDQDLPITYYWPVEGFLSDASASNFPGNPDYSGMSGLPSSLPVAIMQTPLLSYLYRRLERTLLLWVSRAGHFACLASVCWLVIWNGPVSDLQAPVLTLILWPVEIIKKLKASCNRYLGGHKGCVSCFFHFKMRRSCRSSVCFPDSKHNAFNSQREGTLRKMIEDPLVLGWKRIGHPPGQPLPLLATVWAWWPVLQTISCQASFSMPPWLPSHLSPCGET